MHGQLVHSGASDDIVVSPRIVRPNTRNVRRGKVLSCDTLCVSLTSLACWLKSKCLLVVCFRRGVHVMSWRVVECARGSARACARGGQLKIKFCVAE